MSHKITFCALIALFIFSACNNSTIRNSALSGPAKIKAKPFIEERWQAFIEDVQNANREFAKGGMEGTRGIWSHNDDVTIFGGYGGLVEPGWQNVEARLSWASKQFSDGEYT